MTNNRTTALLKTIDIPIDSKIRRNDINTHDNLQFKTIHNQEEIDQLLASGNAHHLHQAHGIPFTIEQLRTMIGKDSFTPFSQELLDDTASIDNLEISDNIKLYLMNLKRKKLKVK